MSEFPYRFEFEWRRPALVRVKSARFFLVPTMVFNRYPGAWIGIAVYWGQQGLSLLWGRPGKVRR